MYDPIIQPGYSLIGILTIIIAATITVFFLLPINGYSKTMFIYVIDYSKNFVTKKEK